MSGLAWRALAAGVLAVLLWLSPAGLRRARAEPETSPDPDAMIADGVDAWLGETNLAAWQEIVDELPAQARALWTGADVRAWIRSGALEGVPQSLDVFGAVRALLAEELKNGAGLLLVLAALSVLSGFVRALTDAPGAGGETAGFMVRCFSLTVVLSAFASAGQACILVIGRMSRFVQLALPALLTLLTAVGGTASVGVFQPAMTVLCGSVTGVMQNVIVPASAAGGVLSMLDLLSGRPRIGELGSLLKKCVKWLIGALSVLYMGATSVRGLSAAAYDGVSVRTAKYAASSLVPMVGGMVSGTMDTMLGCAALVKNAAGLTAIVLLCALALTPLVRLCAQMLLLRAAAAIAQPIADEKLPGMFTQAADMLSYLFAALCAVTLMFLLTVALVTGVGGMGFGG